jgi:hypothetical protein
MKVLQTLDSTGAWIQAGCCQSSGERIQHHHHELVPDLKIVVLMSLACSHWVSVLAYREDKGGHVPWRRWFYGSLGGWKGTTLKHLVYQIQSDGDHNTHSAQDQPH